MVNYYKQLEKHKEAGKFKEIETVKEFEKKIMYLFGFSKKTAKKWVKDFDIAGVINITKIDGTVDTYEVHTK